jgi:hypothetical protein
MGSLSNLYISQSYQGLLTFSTNSGSTSTLTQISDGNGQGLGLYLNNSGSASLSGNLTIGGNLIVSGAFDIEGAIVIRDNVYVTGSIYSSADISSSRMLTGQMTASTAFITNDLNVGGTLFANKVVTLIESSSIIFSSGSNILGDSVLDTQTLNGTIIMSGSSQLTGSMQVSGDISSSTLNGMGNVTLYSQSVDNRLDIVEATASLYVPFSQSVNNRLEYLEGPFSTSVDFRLDQLELFTASVGLVTTQSFQQYTASTNNRLSNLETTSASVNISISNLNVFTASNGNASLNQFTSSQEVKNSTLSNYTASNDAKWTTLTNVTSSILSFTSSVNTKFTTLATLTGSYATTGSNTFVGSNTFNASVNGIVNALSITSNTASMDCSIGNFFTLTLVANTPTRLIPTNIKAGETISLKITQPATTGSLTYNSSTIKFPAGLQYTASVSANAVDILTFVTYDTSTLFSVAVKSLS